MGLSLQTPAQLQRQNRANSGFIKKALCPLLGRGLLRQRIDLMPEACHDLSIALF